LFVERDRGARLGRGDGRVGHRRAAVDHLLHLHPEIYRLGPIGRICQVMVENDASRTASPHTDVVRYGLVGAGYFGAALARAIDGLAGGAVTRVYDPSGGDAVAEELRAETCGSVDDLVASPQVDAVIV